MDEKFWVDGKGRLRLTRTIYRAETVEIPMDKRLDSLRYWRMECPESMDELCPWAANEIERLRASMIKIIRLNYRKPLDRAQAIARAAVSASESNK